ncbi:MAG TPA: hypothetical protein ENO27_00190, partial [Caldithrix sp.]|nr:hypothetical protein [Caldithrix sp.]
MNRLIWKSGSVLFLFMLHLNLLCQPASLLPKSTAYFDSLDNRIATIQKQIPRLKQTHDISLFHLQRELDHTLFIKEYEQYVVDENLFKAKDIVELRLERARLRKDQYSVDFYNRYKDKVY